MAACSASSHPLTTNENPQSTQPDHLWRSTPRTTPQSFTAMMQTAMQQVVQPPATPQRSSRQTIQGSSARRPQCTHMTMNRVYGNYSCQMCGRVPNLGFVYLCQQDTLIERSSTLPDSSEALPVVPDSDDYFEAQAKIARSIGMSASVFKQIRARDYTFDQVETLLAQRRHVIKVIRESEASPVNGAPKSPSRSTFTSYVPSENVIASAGTTVPATSHQAGTRPLPMTPAGTPYNTPTGSTNTTPVKTQVKAVKKQPCNFRVCHACRPFFQDRLPSSFDSALNDELPPVTQQEAANFKLLNPIIVRNMAHRHPSSNGLASQANDDIHMRQGDGSADDTSEDWTPTSASSSMGESELHEAIARYPCPGAGVCPVYSEVDGCAYEHGFDDGQRALAHGFGAEHSREALRRGRGSVTSGSSTSSTGSSISLPEPMTFPLTPATPLDPLYNLTVPGAFSKPGKAASVCGVTSDDMKASYGSNGFYIRGKDSNSSLGSEVEVQGGVALTEEAVECGMPDIADEEQALSRT